MNYLILLTETERAMLEESLDKFHQNIFLGSGNWTSIKAREENRENVIKSLNIIKTFKGGARKKTSETDLISMSRALRWYGGFLPMKNYKNEYITLAYVIEGRNKNIYLFDFDPKNYNADKFEGIVKKDFSKPRLLMVRKGEEGLDYVSEFNQFPEEDWIEYENRAKQKMNQHEYVGNWMVIQENNLNEYVINKNCAYYNI